MSDSSFERSDSSFEIWLKLKEEERYRVAEDTLYFFNFN